MKLVRSWPATVPSGRNYVVDQLDRLIIDGYDMSPLACVGDDVLLIEWDLAVGAEELSAFAARAAQQPDRVLAAPYRLYARHTADPRRDPAIEPGWSAWTYRNGDQRHGGMVQVSPGDPVCHVTGIGLVYLPRALLVAYQDAAAAARARGDEWRFSDVSFCGWHFRCAPHPEILLDWSTRPVHLHYHSSQIVIPEKVEATNG